MKDGDDLGTKQSRVLDDVVDELGFGLAQWQFLGTGATVNFVEGSIKILVGALAVTLGSEWGLHGWQKAALVGVLYAGQGIGSLAAGPFADYFGRRMALIIAMVFSTAISLGSLLAEEFWSMLMWRLGIGLGFGFATAPLNAMKGEMSPSSKRPEMFALAFIIFSAGMIYALGLVWAQDPDMKDLDWRSLTLWGTLPGVVFSIVAFIWLKESLRFLDRTTSHEQVVEALEGMRALNGRDEVDVSNWTTGEPPQNDGLAPLFSRSLRMTTLTLCVSTMVLNFTYYGGVYAMPQVLTGVELGLPAAGTLMIAACVEILGALIALPLGRCLGRKTVLLMYLIGTMVCTLCLCISLNFVPESGEEVDPKKHGLPMALAISMIFAMKIFVTVGFLFVYIYSIEVYPTSCRASGSGVAVGCGRIGSITAPFVFESLLEATGSHEAFFVIGAVLVSLNAVLVWMLPLETKDRKLSAITEETRSLM